MFTVRRCLSLLAGALVASTLVASPPMALAEDGLDEARAKLSKRFPELDVENLKPTPIDGLYEARWGGRVIYVSRTGDHLIQGDLFEIASSRNLTEEARIGARAEAVAKVSEASMIVFGPKNADYTITVFTDIDCGYCRKLHREIDLYNSAGIAVRYLFFPRSGPETESWFKANNVWCADDQNAAMTRAKAGGVVSSPDCGVTPVQTHYRLGEQLGIRGTPAILTEGGQLIPGYVPAAELLTTLQEEAKNSG